MKESRKREQEESLKATLRQIENALADTSYDPTSDTTQETSEKRSSEFDKKLLEKCHRQIGALPPSFDPANEPTTDNIPSVENQTFISNPPQIHPQIEFQPIPSSSFQLSVRQVCGSVPPWQLQRLFEAPFIFDLRKCWETLRDDNYRQIPIQALATTFINLFLQLTYFDSKVVRETLAGCRDEYGRLCDQDYEYYTIADIFSGKPRGWWGSYDKKVQGCGCLSMRMYFTNLTDLEVIEDCARIYGIKFSEEAVAQQDCHDQSSWIRYPSAYPTSDLTHPVFGIFGPPSSGYPFCTESSQPSVILLEWQVGHKAFRLFYSLRQVNSTGQLFCEFIAPPVEHRMYNSYLINRSPSSKVWIHDQIGRAYQYSSTEFMQVHTWAGDLPWASDLEWKFLRGRDVSFVFDGNNPDSMQIGAELIQKFKKFGTEITLIHVKDQGQGETLIEKWTDEHFYEVAVRRDGLDLGNKISRPEVLSIVLDELPAGDTSIDWLVEPLIRRNDFVLIGAKSGVGKTFVAADIGLMIATGESIADWLKVTAPQSVLFIDTELSLNSFLGRYKKIKLNYANTESTEKFSYVSIFDTRTKLNLTRIEDQEWVEDAIAARKAGVLIIDNLGGIIPYEHVQQPKEWEKISKFIKSLNKRKITVLLVHHLTKNGEYSGTNKIRDDSDLVIRLDDDPDKLLTGKKVIEWSFDKPRHLDVTQQFPFIIEYAAESGKMRRTVTRKHSVPDPNPSETACVSKAEIIQHELSDFEVKILTVVRMSEEGCVKAGNFKSDTKGRKRTNVTAYLNKLCDKGLLVSNEKTRNGRKYYDPKKAPWANETPTGSESDRSVSAKK